MLCHASLVVGEDEKALAFKAVAENEGYPADQKTDIHSGTLRAFVKELCEAGVDFPMETIRGLQSGNELL